VLTHLVVVAHAARRCAASARQSPPRLRAGTGLRKPGRSRPCGGPVRRAPPGPWGAGRRPCIGDEPAGLLGHESFSSSTLCAFIMRLTAESWSCVSRIWKACGKPASLRVRRKKRLHRPWKVPIHMPRVFTGSMADRRACISLAALLVKVTAIMPPGDTCPVCSSQAMRVVSTRVLPEPAPARISACSLGRTTAARCSGLRLCKSGELRLLLVGPAGPRRQRRARWRWTGSCRAAAATTRRCQPPPRATAWTGCRRWAAPHRRRPIRRWPRVAQTACAARGPWHAVQRLHRPGRSN
jgi:hypothetical protein